MKNLIEKNLKDKTFADICCGIGGFRVALESMGAECVFSSEIDKHSIAVYEENFGEKPSGDITKINPNDIPDHDILCAGFPCQPFSIAGKQEGFADLTRGTIFYDILKIVKVKKPQVIFLENVANLEAHDNGNTFNIVKSSIEELGYSFNYSVMNALDFGVPQNRKRIYIIAFRNDVKVNDFKFPEPITLTKHIEDILEPESDISAKMYVHRTDVVMNSKDLNSYSDRPIQIGYVAANRQGERIYSIKGTAITLTANGGGQFSKTGGYLINEKLRKLTPRECARLMGFPDDFIISKSNNQAYTQFGNSVVVDVIQMILGSIAEALCDGEDKNNKEINDFSTLKKEYNNPVKNNFRFLSYFKVVDINYIIREFVDKIINKLLSIRLYYKDTAGHTHKNLNLI